MPNKKIWTSDEEIYLATHYKDETREDLARRFGVCAPTITRKLSDMGFFLGNGRRSLAREWTEKELRYLYDHFPYETAGDIASHIGVSDVSVRKKAIELGIRKSPDYDRNRYNKRYVRNYRYNINGKVA